MPTPPISSSLLNLESHRQQFPALENKTYFNYGGQGPMPQAALDAIQAGHLEIQRTGPFNAEIFGWINRQTDELRQALAGLLGTSTNTITLTENVSVGCNIALWGFDWQAGDHILITDCEHPSVLGTIQELQRRFHIEVTTCPIMDTLNHGDPVAVIAEHLQPKTRLVALSHLLWNTGQVLPLTEIVQACHTHRNHLDQPVRVLADAAQSVGSLPLDLEATGVDFYAFTGHKWLCGAAGLGGLYVSSEARSHLHPSFVGWRGLIKNSAGHPTGWQDSGEKYEVATSDYALYPALVSAIAVHDQWGTATERYQRICDLSRYLWQKLTDSPAIHCLRSAPPEAGIVSFQLQTAPENAPRLHAQLVSQLAQNGFMLRTILDPHCVRACVHYFTLESELDRLVDQLQAILETLETYSALK